MNAWLAPSRKRARNIFAQSLQLSSAAGGVSPAIRLKPEAMALLCEVLARLRGVDMPVVQFIPVSGEADAAEVAASFAQVAATCLGRTLLVRSRAPQLPEMPRLEDGVPVATLPRRRTRKDAGGPLEMVPDSAVPGLWHASLGLDPGEALRMNHAPAEAWLDGTALDYRLIVIQSGPPESCPATLSLATRSHGSVLVVKAGSSSLSQSRSVILQVQLTGGTLMGSVLHGAPAAPCFSLSPWWRRITRKSLG